MITLRQSVNQQCTVLFWESLKRANKETKACIKLLLNTFTWIKHFPERKPEEETALLTMEVRIKQGKTQASEKLQAWCAKYSDSWTKRKPHCSTSKERAQLCKQSFPNCLAGMRSAQPSPQRRWKCSIHPHSLLSLCCWSCPAGPHVAPELNIYHTVSSGNVAVFQLKHSRQASKQWAKGTAKHEKQNIA